MALPASSKIENNDVLRDAKATKNHFIQLSDKYDVFHLKCHSVPTPISMQTHTFILIHLHHLGN